MCVALGNRLTFVVELFTATQAQFDLGLAPLQVQFEWDEGHAFRLYF